MVGSAKNRGFTVVELVAVIVIIAAIFAVVFPIVKRKQDEQRMANRAQWTPRLNALLQESLVAVDQIGAIVNTLENGANVNHLGSVIIDSTEFRTSSLSWTLRQGRFDFAKVLIENGAEVNGVDLYGDAIGHVPRETIQPIFWAAVARDDKMFDFLLGYGASLNAKLGGKTVIEWAEEKEFPNEAEWLRAKRAELAGRDSLNEPQDN